MPRDAAGVACAVTPHLCAPECVRNVNRLNSITESIAAAVGSPLCQMCKQAVCVVHACVKRTDKGSLSGADPQVPRTLMVRSKVYLVSLGLNPFTLSV